MASGEAGSMAGTVPPEAGPLAPGAPADLEAADSQPARQEPLIVRYRRVVVACFLILIVMAGVRAAAPAVAGSGPLRRDALGLGIAAEVLLAGLEVALFIRARRSPRAPRLARLLRGGLQRITAILMLAIVAIALVNLLGTRHPNKIMRAFRGTATPSKQPKLKLHRFSQSALPLGDVFYGALALLILAAIVVCVIIVMRWRARLVPGLEAEDPGSDVEELRQAVESGRVALHAVDDARAAIIACYVAMEGSLAQAGTARTVAETPDELLRRATASGLLAGPAAGQLTVLFYEARFSSHALAATARDDARHALDAISAELAGHAASGPAAMAAEGTGP